MICAQFRISFRVTSLLLVMGLLLSTVNGQSKQALTKTDDLLPEKLSLLSDLQGLVARAKQLEKPLARGIAEAEIADAAWSLDRDLAKELLRDAYSLAFPEEAEQAKLRKRPVGAQPQMPTPTENARSAVRGRVMKVAARDKAFANELARSVAEKLGPYEAHMSYASLAYNAIQDDDYEGASKYITQSIEADPTQITGPSEINQLAAKNRAAADEAMLAYIAHLNSMTLDSRDGSLPRVFMALSMLIHPDEFFTRISGIPPPGPAVMRAYVAYVLNSLALMEQQSPSTFTASHLLLLNTYPLLTQYAPDLKQQFLDLEQRSRKPGESLSLPTAKSSEEEYKAKSDKQVERELESDHPDEIVIHRVISRGDFTKARQMIDKLSDGPQKTQLTELLNAQQAISLANKGDISGALKLAESLVKAGSILRVFPVIVGKCAAKNDDACARDSVNQAAILASDGHNTLLTEIPRRRARPRVAGRLLAGGPQPVHRAMGGPGRGSCAPARPRPPRRCRAPPPRETPRKRLCSWVRTRDSSTRSSLPGTCSSGSSPRRKRSEEARGEIGR